MDGLAKKAQSCIIGMQGGYAFDTKPLAKVPSEEQLFTLCASRWPQMPRKRDRAPVRRRARRWRGEESDAGEGEESGAGEEYRSGAGEVTNLALARERNRALARR